MFVALILILVFAFSLSSVCFADDSSAAPGSTITILKQPGGSSTYKNDGAPYSSTWFSVRALGVASYRWQIRYGGTDTWYDIPSPDVTEEWTDGLILTIKLHLRTHEDIVNHVGCWYRCVLTDSAGLETITAAATIVDNPPVCNPCPPCWCPPPCAPCTPCVPCVPACPVTITPTCPYVPPTTVITTTTTTTTTTIS